MRVGAHLLGFIQAGVGAFTLAAVESGWVFCA